MRVRLGNGSYPSAEFRVNTYLTLSVRPNDQAACSPKCPLCMTKGKVV